MKTKIVSILTAVVLWGYGTAGADILEISAVTNKPTYHVGEEVMVVITAYNPGPDPVSIGTVGDEASYIMDDVFDWKEGKVFPLWVMSEILEPYSSRYWGRSHGSYEMGLYPLNVGTHTVVGYVIPYGWSTPVEFEVIPEPSSILFLITGSLVLCKKKIFSGNNSENLV